MAQQPVVEHPLQHLSSGEAAPTLSPPAEAGALQQQQHVQPAESCSARIAAQRGTRQQHSSDAAAAPALQQQQQHQEDECCRICLGTDNLDGLHEALLDHQCTCSGSVDRVHLSCLTAWVVERRSLACELCKSTYKEPTLTHLKAVLAQHSPRPPQAQQGAFGGGDQTFSIITFREGVDGADNRGVGGATTWQSIMCHALVLLVLLAVILYLTVFSSIAPAAAASDWTSILWRVLTILIPAYLVIRLSITILSRWQAERILQQQQEARRAQAQTPGSPRQPRRETQPEQQETQFWNLVSPPRPAGTAALEGSHQPNEAAAGGRAHSSNDASLQPAIA